MWGRLHCSGRGGSYGVTFAGPALLQSSCGSRHPQHQVPCQGPQQSLSLCRSQGSYRPYSISLPSVFQCPLQSLASKLHISWDSVGCSLCSSEDWLGVPVGCTSKWVQLPFTSSPSSSPPEHPILMQMKNQGLHSLIGSNSTFLFDWLFTFWLVVMEAL